MKNRGKLSKAEPIRGRKVQILKEPDVFLEHAGRMRRRMAILGMLLCLSGFGKAEAASIIYTWSSIGSGSLGTNSFFDAPFTITSTAEVTQITEAPLGVLLVSNIAATVSVSGFGIATFTIPTDTVANRSNSLVGIGASIQDDAILFVGNPAFATYDLRSSIESVGGPPARSIEAQFATTAGIFSLSAVSTVTFQAEPPPVLTIRKIESSQIQLRWATNTVPYDLDRTATLPASVWTPVTNTVSVIGGEFLVTLEPSANAQFFRLRLR